MKPIVRIAGIGSIYWAPRSLFFRLRFGRDHGGPSAEGGGRLAVGTGCHRSRFWCNCTKTFTSGWEWLPPVSLALLGAMNSSPTHLWSAVPTPLTTELNVDSGAVEKMIHATIAEGITGVFLAGSCGEGPWLSDRERNRLVQAAVNAAGGQLQLAMQVSDISVPRMLDNIRAAQQAGAHYAVIAQPTLMENATPDRIAALFEKAVTLSPLPVGIYDLGAHRPHAIPEERLKATYLLPNVHFVKDSSAAPERRAIALAARREKSSLKLFNGDEFRCLEYLEAGYDGCLFGGAVAVAPALRAIAQLFHAGRLVEAREVEGRMRSALFGIYGGESFTCWLTGLKYYMVRKGLFQTTSSYLEYPLSEECRMFIERYAAERFAA